MFIVFAGNKVPCKGCEKRSPECHGKCEDYTRWKEEYTDSAKEAREKRNNDMTALRVSIAGEQRMKNRSRRKRK